MRRVGPDGVAATVESDRLGRLTARLAALGCAALLVGGLTGGDLVAAASQPSASSAISSQSAATTPQVASPSLTPSSSATTAQGTPSAATSSPSQAVATSWPSSSGSAATDPGLESFTPPVRQVTIDSQGAHTTVTQSESPGVLDAIGQTSYIVELSAKAAPSLAVPSFERTLGRSLQITRRFSRAINGFVTKMTAAEARRLETDSRVLRIQPDRAVSVDASEAAPSWGLDRIDQRSLPLSGTYDYTDYGSGVRAYVIDTGIYPNDDFGNRLEPGVSTVPGDSSTLDCYGHGTHVAGTIGGTVYGVAKGVELVPVRVLDCSGSGTDSSVIAGIDWMIADHQPGTPAVANMSLGGALSPALNDAVQSAVAAGIVMVVAAGNDAADACGYSPASEPSALTVAATDSSDTSASFSNEGSCVDLYAPGVNIVSDYNTSPTATETMSGTSMATPHVTGIAALYAARYPGASASEIEDAILADATPGVVTVRDPTTPNRLAFIGPSLPAPAQQILFDLPGMYISAGAVTLTATASSGLPVAYESLTPATCGVADTVATPIGSGTCTIEATQAGNATYDPASVTRSVQVYPNSQTIDGGSLSDIVYGQAVPIGASASSGLSVTYSGLTSSTCTVVDQSVTGVGRGVCEIRVEQAGNADYGPAVDVLLALNVIATSQQLSPGSHGSPLDAGESISYAPTSSAGEEVGVTSLTPATCTASAGALNGVAEGTCTVSLSQPGDENVLPATAAVIKPVTAVTPYFTDVAIGPDGNPVVAYSVAGELYIEYCESLTCAAPRTVDLGATGVMIQDLSVAVASDGRVVVAYAQAMTYQLPNQSNYYWDSVLRVAACSDALCRSWTDTMVDLPNLTTSGSDVAVVSMKLSPQGLPVIAYDGIGGTSHGVGIAICADFGCTTSTLRAIANSWPDDYGGQPSLAFDADGLPVIAYIRWFIDPVTGTPDNWATAVLVRCGDAGCTQMTKTDLGPAYQWYQPAVVVPADNRPVVFWTDNLEPHDSYSLSDFAVRRASCLTVDCSSISAGIFDTSAGVGGRDWSYAGGDVSAAIGADGLPVATYTANYVYGVVGGVDYMPEVVVARACQDVDCLTFSPGYVDQFTDATFWLLHAAPKVASLRGGGILIAYGTFQGSYAGSDPRWIGLKLATCRDDDCSLHDSLPVGVDTTPPAVLSFASTTTSPTSATTIDFSLTFSEPISGLTTSGLSLSGTSTDWTVESVSGTGTSYDVMVTSSAPTPGTIVLTLTAGSVEDVVRNPGPEEPASTPEITWTAPIAPGPVTNTFHAVAPIRLLDTRSANGLTGKLAAGVPETFQITDRGGASNVPDSATAVTANVTIVSASAAASVYLGPTPIASPTTATIVFNKADNTAYGSTISISDAGTMSVTYMASSGATDLVVDVTGFFTPDASGDTYHPLTPARLLDTRSKNGLSGKFKPNVPRTFTVRGRGGVPANAVAVTGNLTVTDATGGWAVYLGPAPLAKPVASTINFVKGQTRANSLTVPLSSSGTLSATFLSSGKSTIDLVFDVTGYYTADLSGARYVPITSPAYILDTGAGIGSAGKLSANTPRTFGVVGSGGVPADATGITGIVSVYGQTNSWAVFVGPTPIAKPSTSSLNFLRTDRCSNGITVALSGTGTLSVTYMSGAGNYANVVIVVTGYFVPSRL